MRRAVHSARNTAAAVVFTNITAYTRSFLPGVPLYPCYTRYIYILHTKYTGNSKGILPMPWELHPNLGGKSSIRNKSCIVFIFIFFLVNSKKTSAVRLRISSKVTIFASCMWYHVIYTSIARSADIVFYIYVYNAGCIYSYTTSFTEENKTWSCRTEGLYIRVLHCSKKKNAHII